MNVESYKDLIVWQKSVDLVIGVYELTNKFPKEEVYGITSQMKRSSISIPSNIAEGFGRSSLKERSHFYSMAYGSAFEPETQIYIAKKLLLAQEKYFLESDRILVEVLKMLNKLRNNVRTRSRIS